MEDSRDGVDNHARTAEPHRRRYTSEVHTSCILCSLPRSGSWLLADFLDQTELAGRLREYFRPDHERWYKAWGVRKDAPYSRFVGAALTQTSTPNGVFGVKLHWYQLEWFVARLRELPGADPNASAADIIYQRLPEPRYIHLYRRDTVRQAISWYRATYSDRWFERTGGFQRRNALYRPLQEPEIPDWGHIRFLENSLIEDEANWRAYFASAGIEPLDVCYETFVNSPPDTVKDVLAYLGIAVPAVLPPLEVRLRKQADDRTERLAEAYLSVRDTVEPRHFDVQEDRDRVTPVPQPLDSSWPVGGAPEP